MFFLEMDGELMFAVLDVAEVFSRPHIVLPKEHSLDAVFFSPPLSLCFPPLSPLSPHSLQLFKVGACVCKLPG